MALDTLSSRERHVALFERYGALLNDHQREIVALHLDSDWSLAEIASRQGVSRAAVHDLIRRSLEVLEDAERRLGLLAEETRRRQTLGELTAELADLRRRVARLEGRLADV